VSSLVDAATTSGKLYIYSTDRTVADNVAKLVQV
jgi:hypothetical protein